MKNFIYFFLVFTFLPFFCLAQSKVSEVIGDIASIIRNIAIAAGILMIVVGGFQYMISGGDPSKIADAKDKIYSAVFGLLIIALAEVIAKLLGGK